MADKTVYDPQVCDYGTPPLQGHMWVVEKRPFESSPRPPNFEDCMSNTLEQRLWNRANEAGYPKSELYKEAASHIARTEDIIAQMRTHILSANLTSSLIEKQKFLDLAVESSRNKTLAINQST